MKKESRTTLIFLGAALVIIIGLIIFLSFAANADQQQANILSEEEVRISLADAKTAFDAGDALIIDVRSESQFVESRIPGAILIPVNDIAGNEPAVNKDMLILTYCT